MLLDLLHRDLSAIQQTLHSGKRFPFLTHGVPVHSYHNLAGVCKDEFLAKEIESGLLHDERARLVHHCQALARKR